MTEEFIYDKQRIIIIVMILAIILSSGLIIVAVWPKPPPVINDIQTDFSVITDDNTISEKYTDFFNGTISTNNSILYKIVIDAQDLYFMERMALTITVDTEAVDIIGVLVTNFFNEASILFGETSIPTVQSTYLRTVLVGPGKYVIYIFLDIFAEDYAFNYNIRVSG